MHWETALVSSQVFVAVVYRVETYFSSFGSLVVDFRVVWQLVAVPRQLVLYLVAILTFPFVEPHHGGIFL